MVIGSWTHSVVRIDSSYYIVGLFTPSDGESVWHPPTTWPISDAAVDAMRRSVVSNGFFDLPDQIIGECLHTDTSGKLYTAAEHDRHHRVYVDCMYEPSDVPVSIRDIESRFTEARSGRVSSER